MDLCKATEAALRAEAARNGVSVEELVEWIELCGVRERLARDLAVIDQAIRKHRVRRAAGRPACDWFARGARGPEKGQPAGNKKPAWRGGFSAAPRRQVQMIREEV